MSERSERSEHGRQPVFGSHFLDPEALEQDDPEDDDTDTDADRPDPGEPEPADPGRPAVQQRAMPVGGRIGAAALDLVLIVATLGTGWGLRPVRAGVPAPVRYAR